MVKKAKRKPTRWDRLRRWLKFMADAEAKYGPGGQSKGAIVAYTCTLKQMDSLDRWR